MITNISGDVDGVRREQNAVGEAVARAVADFVAAAAITPDKSPRVE
jgi:hypothetical protein